MRTDARAVPSTMYLWLSLAGALLLASPAPAQRPEPPPPIGPARAALQAGRAAEAVERADAVLKVRPADVEALGVKVDALIALDTRDKALDAYDAWRQATRSENLPIAGRLARAELDALGRQGLAGIEMEAVTALAAQGEASARARLDKTAWATPPTTASWPAVVGLARLGDARAVERVLRAARESSGSSKLEALGAIRRAAVKTPGAVEVLRAALATRDAPLQAAAAETAAALELKALIPDLQRVALEGEQFGKFSAAVALAELGASGGESLIDAGAASPAEDMRLQAAAARRARGIKTWADPVRPLLDSPDGLTRFRAAELLLAVDRAAALKVLTAGTTDANAAVRGEVARIFTADPQVDTSELRRLLRDGAPLIRLHAARALLERAQRKPE